MLLPSGSRTNARVRGGTETPELEASAPVPWPPHKDARKTFGARTRLGFVVPSPLPCPFQLRSGDPGAIEVQNSRLYSEKRPRDTEVVLAVLCAWMEMCEIMRRVCQARQRSLVVVVDSTKAVYGLPGRDSVQLRPCSQPQVTSLQEGRAPLDSHPGCCASRSLLERARTPGMPRRRRGTGGQESDGCVPCEKTGGRAGRDAAVRGRRPHHASADRWCGDAAGDELQRCGAGCAATGSTSRRIGSLRGLQRTGRKL